MKLYLASGSEFLKIVRPGNQCQLLVHHSILKLIILCKSELSAHPIYPFCDLGAVQGAEWFVSPTADLPQGGPKAPLVCG